MEILVTDVVSFKAFLRDRARETWNNREIPYYLSLVGTELKRQNVDYRQFIGPFRLVQWAAKEDIPDTKFVSHPTVKAKVGLVPSDAEFDFSTETLENRELAKPRGGGSYGHDLIKFVESLRPLSDDLAGGFKVPAKVLVAFLKS